MSEDKSETKRTVERRVIVTGLGDLGFMLFLSVAAITCGWSPNCARVEARR